LAPAGLLITAPVLLLQLNSPRLNPIRPPHHLQERSSPSPDTPCDNPRSSHTPYSYIAAGSANQDSQVVKAAAGQQARLDHDNHRRLQVSSLSSSADVVSKVVKGTSPVARSWAHATLLYLPRSMARMVFGDAAAAMVFMVQAPRGERRGLIAW
jgi:hypothetical protein